MGLIAGCGNTMKSPANSDADETVSEKSNESKKTDEKDVFSEAVLNIDVAASLKNSMTEIVELYS